MFDMKGKPAKMGHRRLQHQNAAVSTAVAPAPLFVFFKGLFSR